MTGASPAPSRTLTVLAVDDDAVVREVLAMTFAAVTGWRISIADSGTQALEMAAAVQPDVVLLDLTMAGMDGIATRRALARGTATADVPVVFLTADAQAASGLRRRVPGTAGVILKPFDPLRLPDRLRAIVEGPARRAVAPTDPALQGALAALWDRRRPEVLRQVRELEAMLVSPEAAAPDGEPLLARARLLVHSLAGALGSLGLHASSRLARSLGAQLHGIDSARLAASLDAVLVDLESLRGCVETEIPDP